MFTGIIQKLGHVVALTPVENALRINVATGFEDLVLGESVAINGVCLTVARESANSVESAQVGTATNHGNPLTDTPVAPGGVACFFLSPETLLRTCLGALKPGSKVNLERALRAGDRLSGHWVQGHVDGLAKAVSITALGGGSHAIQFKLHQDLLKYVVEKGSISLNGISLTVNHLSQPDLFDVAIIPHTWEATHLHALREGDSVNVEVDILAKYVERLSTPFLSAAQNRGNDLPEKGPVLNA